MNETRVCKIRKFYIRKVKSFCTYLCIFFYRILETSKSVVCQNLMEHVKGEDGNTFWLQNPEWLPVGSIQFLSLPPQPMTSDLKLWIHFSKDSNKFLMKKKIWKSFIILLSSSRFQINSVVSFRQSNTIIWTLTSPCTGISEQSNMWSVNDGLSGNLRKPAAEVFLGFWQISSK